MEREETVGDGGPAGAGAKGGNGGRGGDGAGCYCARAGIGEGGSGGAAGAAVGEAGTIVMSVSSNYMQTNPMMGGARGEGVVVGGGSAGMAGNYGVGGSGGLANCCDRGRGGSGGAGASGAPRRRWRSAGEPGRPGESGAPGYTILDAKRGISGLGLAYEPGITTKNCTQWFSARSYIGCFQISSGALEVGAEFGARGFAH